MAAVDIAERTSRVRAVIFLFFALLISAAMVVALKNPRSDFTQGLWFGLLFGCTLNLAPIKRWLRPNNAVVRLIEDEGARENRRLSCVVGFWAATIAAMILFLASRSDVAIGADALAQIVTTAGMASAMLAFGLLELRAAR
jgi:multisubunit Na+/H+ antiporter MnhB subunit